MTRNFGIDKAKFLCYLWLVLEIGQTRGDANTVLDVDAERLSNVTQHLAKASVISGFQDPDLKEAIKSALGNNSVSEVVVKKNLMLFPLNAPNLVLMHKQEFHTIPEAQGVGNTTDANATYTELAEVNEFSLSELIPLNDSTIKANRSEKMEVVDGQISKTPKELQVISGFNLHDGLITEKIPLPETIKRSISVPKDSVLDLFSTTPMSSISTEEESKGNFETEDLDPPKEVDDSSLIKKIIPRSDGSFSDQESIPLEDKSSVRSENLKASDMEVAEDIVFRPLFRYRQETRLKPKNNYNEAFRRSSYRRPNPYRYYETSYVPRKRYRPREYDNY